MKSRKKKKKKLSVGKKILIFCISFFVMEVIGGIFLLYGPLPKFRNWLVTTAMTTMHHQYLATWFYSDQWIEEILASNRVIESSSNTNLSKINTDKISSNVYLDEYEKEDWKKD